MFRKGDKVVYPHHGAAIIQDITNRELLGETRKYFVLKLAYGGDLTLMVPVDNTEEVGLRDIVSKKEAKKVLDVLKEGESASSTNWTRRFKTNWEKLRSGDIFHVAEVVRDLSIREGAKGLSAGEKRMLAKARQILVSELTFAVDATEQKAEAMIDKILQDAHSPATA